MGRAGSEHQNWTVASGSHPRLRARITNYGRCIGKVGEGDVNMPDVDLELEINNMSPWGGQNNGSISQDGLQPGSTLYGGTIRANSYWIDATNSTVDIHYCFIAGKLCLDGQGGQEGGAPGNGRAFTVWAGPRTLYVRLTTDAPINHWWSPINSGNKPKLGKVEIAPGGGDFTLTNMPGSEMLGMNIMAYEADGSNAVLIANRINLAGTNIYISDRDEFRLIVGSGSRPEYSNGFATIEFRGDFVNQSIQTNLFHIEHSILRCVGTNGQGKTFFEVAGKDYGASGTGLTNNFAVDKLILGKDSTGAVSFVHLRLKDAHDNNLIDAEPEALYVRSLELYNKSILQLDGHKLYYMSGGAWVEAIETGKPFPGGDGTGYIGVPSKGTVVLVR